MIVRNAVPGKKINLFDSQKHRQLFGVLFFRTLANLEISDSEQPPVDESPLDEKPKKEDPLYLRFSFWVDRKIMGLIKSFRSYFFESKKMASYLLEKENTRTDEADFKNHVDSAKNVDFVKRFEEAAKLVKQTNRIQSLKKKLITKKNKIKAINWQNLTPSFSMEGVGRTYSRLRLSFAFLLLIVSFFSLAGIILPILMATISAAGFNMPTYNSPTPAPTPYRYDYYYQESGAQFYPITEFRISIPKIGLESNIVDNVDPKIEQEYKSKLQFGVAHAKGSYLPPEDGSVYLFAHSTDTVENIARFNAKFFSVRELNNGDEIDVFFNGKKYRYSVKDKFIINPEKVDIIQNSNANLILQTCWPPGTDWQRLIVLADKIQEEGVTQ